MDRVLVTGGAGFIGRHLVQAILKAGAQVVVLDNFMSRTIPPAGSGSLAQNITVKGDIRDAAILEEVFRKYRPDTVIHLAAVSDADSASGSPQICFSINVGGLNNLLNVTAQTRSVKKFIFTSSSYVYGDFNYEPADETHPLNSRHIYGISKIKGEGLTAYSCAKHNIDYTIIRPTAVYGLGASPERVYCKMIIGALTRKEIVIHNGGKQKLDFTCINDLVQGFLKALGSPDAKNQIFNLSRGRARTVAELAGLIAEAVPGTRIVNQQGGLSKPARGALDISKARNMLGFNPRIDIEEGIPDLIEGLKRSLKGKNDLPIPALH